jgi:hypothetical protein
MKVAVSIPTSLFERADESAARLGINRSQFYARALEAFVLDPETDPVSCRLDELADETGPVDGRAAARRLIDAGTWEW